MRSSALKRRQSCLGDHLLKGLSPVLHEIERVEDVKAVGPGQHKRVAHEVHPGRLRGNVVE
jgi:hypothetical protein